MASSKELKQMIYALERAAVENEAACRRLFEQGNYNCQFYENDAEQIRAAIKVLKCLL